MFACGPGAGISHLHCSGSAGTRSNRNDVRRDAKLTAAGYTVLRFKSKQVYDGSALYTTLGSTCGARGATRPAAA